MDIRSELLARVAAISDVLARGSEQAERACRLTGETVEALRGQGLFAMLAPRALGGMEIEPTSAYAVWEAVGRIDSAAGWNLAQQGSAGFGMSARLPPAGIERLYGAGVPILSGAGAPPCPAVEVDGGFRLSGRVPFVSGCHHADWLFVIAMPVTGGAPRLDPATGQPQLRVAFLPRSDARILDSWDTLGMRGTGSADVLLEDLFVPAALVAPLAGPDLHPAFAGPLFAFHPWQAIHGEAVASLAIAGAAIDRLVTIAHARSASYSQVPLREREYVQLDLGRAVALVDAARAYLHQSAQEAWAVLSDGQSLTMAERLRLQLAACNAAEAGARAVDLVHEAAGSASIRNDQGLARLFRDAHTVTQHATKSTPRYISAGRVMLGLASDAPLLAG
ncbi:MAG: acyl-CoA dehydrogenase family protein [Gammaproteobacteria bacterium]